MQAYLDNNATTQPSDEVVEAMNQMLREAWGNPSSVHRFGQMARQRVELARQQLSGLLGCAERELVFTSGATESANVALRGLRAAKPGRSVVVSSLLEHSAVRQTCGRLELDGATLVNLPTDADGLFDPDDLSKALDAAKDQVALVALHWINNETGVIQPIDAIGKICRDQGVPLLVDVTQAVGKVACDLSSMPIDVAIFSAHKFHGPKGVGGMYVATGTSMVPQMLGGPHENERRGGTENTAGIVGMGVAAEQARAFIASGEEAVGRQRRDRLEAGIVAAVPEAVVISQNVPRIWNTSAIGFPPLSSEAILLLLSERGISAAAGAACASGSIEPSPVLLAQGLPEPVAHGAIRLSLCRETTDDQIDYALEVIPSVIAKLRSSMPV